MKERKPRTATERTVNKKLATHGTECEWWDEGSPECFLPWSSEKGRNGNLFVCRKQYYKYLASADKVDERIVEEFERRNK